MLQDQLAKEILKGNLAKELGEKIYPYLRTVEEQILEEFKSGDELVAKRKWIGFQEFVNLLYTEINTGTLAAKQMENINESASH